MKVWGHNFEAFSNIQVFSRLCNAVLLMFDQKVSMSFGSGVDSVNVLYSIDLTRAQSQLDSKLQVLLICHQQVSLSKVTLWEHITLYTSNYTVWMMILLIHIIMGLKRMMASWFPSPITNFSQTICHWTVIVANVQQIDVHVENKVFLASHSANVSRCLGRTCPVRIQPGK